MSVLTLCLSTQLMSQEIEGSLTPGGFALVPIFSLDRPSMRFGLTPMAVLDDRADDGVWLGLVGIDLLTAPGHYLLTKSKQGSEQQDHLFDLAVQPIEHDLRPSRTITTRIEEYFRNALTEDAEDYTAKDLAGEWQQSRFFSFPFVMPLEHGEMDEQTVGAYVRYPSGALEPVNALFLRSSVVRAHVLAPSGGIIYKIEQPEGRLANTSIVMDHGQGVFSILKGEVYPEVEIGDIVQAGAIIALFTVDGSREAEGTRELSWQLVLNGDLIDPNHFLKLDLSAYFQKLTADAEAHFLSIEVAEQNKLLQMEPDPSNDTASNQADDSAAPAAATAPTITGPTVAPTTE